MKGFTFTLSILMLLALMSLSALGGFNDGGRVPVPYPHQLVQAPALARDFTDMIYYDDGNFTQWFGGLWEDFDLATRFTTLAPFDLEGFQLLLEGTGDFTWYVMENDPSGTIWVPGTAVMASGSGHYDASVTWQEVPISPPVSFGSGAEFWIKVGCPGAGPNEAYDPAPTTTPNGSRSITYFAPWDPTQLPDPSPGDNFIQAGGNYTVTWDPGVSAITHNDHFFVMNEYPVTIPVDITVHNYGDTPVPMAGESMTLHCQRIPENSTYPPFEPYLDEMPTTIWTPIAPGAEETYHFNYEVSAMGRYNFLGWIEYVRDEVASNNKMAIEFQVYDPTTGSTSELRYDNNGDYLGASYLTTADDGLSMRFNPNLSGETFVLDEIKFDNTMVPGGTSAAQIKVFADAGGSPAATPIWQTGGVQSPSGWNTYTIDTDPVLPGVQPLVMTQPFYLTYCFLGPTTDLLRFDGLLKSGQAWLRSGSAWYADPLAYDWRTRAALHVEPEFSLEVTLVSGLYIPPAGGTLVVHVAVTNNSLLAFTRDIWYDIVNYEGVTMIPPTPILSDYYFEGGETYETDLDVDIPQGWAGNRYTFVACVGMFDAVIHADDYFYFYKTQFNPPNPRTVPGGTHLSSTGLQTVIPSEYSLSQNYPNPFNPVTMIDFGMPQDGYVNLAIYDIRGNLVTTLMKGQMGAGFYSVEFDASSLASGVYLYRLEAGSFTELKKMAFVK